MNKLLAISLCVILVGASLSGCFGERGDTIDDALHNDDEDINQHNGDVSDETTVNLYGIICPDGSNGTLQWGVMTCAEPEVFKASDVSNETVNLTLQWYKIAVAEWGNYGPVEIYIIGNDTDAAKQLEDDYCERHKALDSNWKEEWDCANDNYQIFTRYIEDGGAAISTLKRTYLDYDFMMMIMSAKYPGPEEEDYKPVTLHEYFHIFQHSHLEGECTGDSRDACERDVKMGGKDTPWWSEGGAEYMAQKLYSNQEGVRANYLQDVMRWKLDSSREGYNNQNVSLNNLTRDSQINAYDVGSWFIAYLIHHEGEDAFLNGFYTDIDDLGFNLAFENNFNKTKYQYVADFDMFFKQPVEDIMTIIPSNTGINEDSNMDN